MMKINIMLDKISPKTNSRKEMKAEEPTTKEKNPIKKAPDVVRQFMIKKIFVFSEPSKFKPSS